MCSYKLLFLTEPSIPFEIVGKCVSYDYYLSSYKTILKNINSMFPSVLWLVSWNVYFETLHASAHRIASQKIAFLNVREMWQHDAVCVVSDVPATQPFCTHLSWVFWVKVGFFNLFFAGTISQGHIGSNLNKPLSSEFQALNFRL